MLFRNAFILVLLLTAIPCQSADIRVPADYLTIQAAIDAATDGDRVLIADGTYSGDGNRDISFKGKAITVASVNGPDHCIIDCQGSAEDQHRGFIFESGETNLAVLQGLTVTGGFALRGGGIYTANNASPRISGCRLAGNTAAIQGGSSDPSQFGGGAYLSNNTIMENCVITSNHAEDRGGGLYATGHAQVEHVVITSNTSVLSGGGVHCAGEAVVSNSTVDHNYCESDYGFFLDWPCGGGGVLLEDSASMADCIIEFNESILYGGGVYVADISVIGGCIVRNNKLKRSSGGGGGIYCSSGTVYRCIVSSNSAKGEECKGGGGIFCSSGQISECKITGNITTEDGGGVYYENGLISSCEISGNTCEEGGGGIYSEIESQIENCLITDNIADYGAGVRMYLYFDQSGIHNLVNCTIANNTALSEWSNHGGVVCSALILASGEFNISDCIIWGNSGNQIQSATGYLELHVSNCCIQNGFAGPGNISDNPLFTLGPRGAYYLSNSSNGQGMDSPCIDSGSDFSEFVCLNGYPDTICMNTLTTRTDKETDYNMVDMGYHYSTETADSVRITVQMPSEYYSPGTPCSCSVTVTNGRDTDLDGYPLFVLLNVYGSFFFAPGFTQDIDHFLGSHPVFPVGDTIVTVLPEFTWPAGAGSGSGIVWYAVLLDPGMTMLFGELGSFTFGWGE